MVEKTPWVEAQNSIWLSTQISCRRNLIVYPFSEKCDLRQKAQLEDVLTAALLKIPELANGKKQAISTLSPLQREQLAEQQIYPMSPKEGEEPTLISSEGASALLHANDHLTLQIHNTNFQAVSASLQNAEKILTDLLPFAFHTRFGYLTADPAHCGTALEVVAYLHLPALIHTKQELPTQFRLFSLPGTGENYPGDIVLVQNRCSLGPTEEEILKEMFTGCTNLMTREQQLRENLSPEQEAHLKDLVSRSLGLLTHSYELQIEETLEALSHIKLGLTQKWVSGVEESLINDLLFRCQKAHLLLTFSEAIPLKELPQKRAAFLHEKIRPAQLNF